jgi:hypothetical protein
MASLLGQGRWTTRIKAIATVSMFDLGRVRREGLDGEITSALRRRCDAQSISVVGSLHGVPDAPRWNPGVGVVSGQRCSLQG